MIDFSTVKSLDDIPEGVRSLFSVTDGIVSMDETKIKTAQDVQSVLDAKEHEKNDHKATKQKLAAWEKLGKAPEEVQDILDEYPTLKEGVKSGEEYLNEKREWNKQKRALEGFKDKYEQSQTVIQELQSYKNSVLKSAKWKELREELGKTFDVAKLDMFYEDIEDRLQLDDVGEFAAYKGKSVKDYFSSRAEGMGWRKSNTPGGSNPGAPVIPAKAKEPVRPYVNPSISYLDDAALEQARR